MIRHVVLLTLRKDAPPDAAESIATALGALASVVPSVRDYQVGVDAGIAVSTGAGNATVGATALFDDEAGYLEYRDHPAHQAVIREHIDPVRESRASIQFVV